MNKKLFSLIGLAILLIPTSKAQLVTTIAGGGTGDGGAAINTTAVPKAMAVSNNGTIYYSDAVLNCTRKITPSGVITTLLHYAPDIIQMDASGNLLFAMNALHKVFKYNFTTNDTVLIAGTGVLGNTGNNMAATTADIGNLQSIAIAPSSGDIYLSDSTNNIIRKIDAATGIITSTSIGSGAIAIGGSGTYYLYRHISGTLYQYTLGGTMVTSVAVGSGGSANGIAATSANVYVSIGNYVYQCTGMYTNGISVFAGTGTSGYNGDGISATTAQLLNPGAIGTSGNNVYIATGNRIRAVLGGMISTVAGNGTAAATMGGDGLDARLAMFSNAAKIATDASGNVYIVDGGNGRIRKIDAATNMISTFAGGGAVLGDNGLATDAQLVNPTSIAFDNSGNAYIVDAGHNRIRKVDASAGTITTYAGGGSTSLGNSTSGWTTATNMNLTNLSDITFVNGKIYFNASGSASFICYVNSSGNLANSGAPFTSTLISNIRLTGNGTTLYYSFNSSGSNYILRYNTSTNALVGTYIYPQGSPASLSCDNTTGNIYYSANGLHYVDLNNNNYDSLFTYNYNTPPSYSCSTVDGTDLSNFCGSQIGAICKTTTGILFSYGSKIKFACNNSSLVSGNAMQTFYLDTASTPQLLMDYCNLHAGIQTTGSNPVSGTITSKVSFSSSVPVTAGGDPYVQEHYDIEPVTSPSNSTGTLTLFFTQAEFDNYNLVAGTNYPHFPTGSNDTAGIGNIRITQAHGTGTTPGNYTGYTGTGPATVLIDPADSNIVWNSNAARWEITFDVTGFSGFYLHTTVNGNPLSLKLLSFTGETSNHTNKLTWQTTNEQNNKGFTIQRSADGKDFIDISFVNAANTEATKHSYNYTDTHPLNGVNYYRLKIEDINGSFEYSTTLKLENSNTIGHPFTIAPNPASSTLYVTTATAGKELTIYDVTGRKMLSIILSNEKNEVNITTLSPGIYFYQYSSEKGKLLKE